MAKKLSTLVVPVKLDTSGMNAGLSEMRSKMSRVRGSGGGGAGGAMGGSAPGFAAGVVPFGVGGGTSSAAAAMAAAFGASVGSRAVGAAGNIFGPDKGVGQMVQKNRMEHNRQTVLGNFFQNIADFSQAKIGNYGSANARIKEMINTGAYTASKRIPRTAAEISNYQYRIAQTKEFDRQRAFNQSQIERHKRIKDRFQRYATNVTNFATTAAALGGAGGAVGAGLAVGERMLRSISPIGIGQTMSDLKPFENRAAGQYDIAQGMRNRAMTASTGNIGLGQQFFLGVGTAAGGKRSRVEQMGQNLYESLGFIAGTAGGLLEGGLNYGISIMEDAVASWGIRGQMIGKTTNYDMYNSIKRIYN